MTVPTRDWSCFTETFLTRDPFPFPSWLSGCQLPQAEEQRPTDAESWTMFNGPSAVFVCLDPVWVSALFQDPGLCLGKDPINGVLLMFLEQFIRAITFIRLKKEHPLWMSWLSDSIRQIHPSFRWTTQTLFLRMFCFETSNHKVYYLIHFHVFNWYSHHPTTTRQLFYCGLERE